MTKPIADPRTVEADAEAFSQLQAVLSGALRLGLDASSSKMLRILLGDRDTDTSITSERFVVHFGPRKLRRPQRYAQRLAPRIVSELLERGCVRSVAAPVVIGIPAGGVPGVTGAFPAWSYAAKLVWVVPRADSLTLFIRGSVESCTTPFVRPIPMDGALALRELAEWVPSDAYCDLAAPAPCPACGAVATRYRALLDALVCVTCGRSFEAAPDAAWAKKSTS